jgi:drug/metabolite transporter (DMT)-like permease
MTVSARIRPHVMGMILMGSVGLVFAAHDTLSKTLIMSLPVIFVAWVRYLIHSCIISTVILAGRDRALPKTRRPWLHLCRAVCLLADSLTFLYGLTHVPLAESTALVFLAPAFVTLLSPLVFGTRIDRSQWLPVIIGFVGVVVIINPQGEGFTPWLLFPLATAFFFALYQILTQLAGETDSPSTSSFYVGVFSTLILTLSVPFYWGQASAIQWSQLVVLGSLGLAAHFLISKSYSYASSAVLAPLGYLQIVFATLFGVIVFSDYPPASSIIGIALVLLSGFLVYGRPSRHDGS